jgi:two-component system, cell cycle response regulator
LDAALLLPIPTDVTPDAPMRVLLAEDDPVARLLTTRLLRKAGYEVIAVADGDAALATLRETFCPLLLTDWEMPGLDGPALLRAIRAGDWPGYVYAVLLTGRDAREHVLQGLEAGADDYLKKPVDQAELIARLKTGRRIATLEARLRDAERVARRLSLTDALTGAYNRRHLVDELPLELERARRHRHALSLAICDIDHFKKINDTYGHQAGDEVLRAFARLLCSSVREIDWVARFGGEEFVVVLPATDQAGALRIAEKLRVQAESLRVPFAGHAIQLTASFGVGSIEPGWPEAPLPEALIEHADLCLYRSKQAGRNRVTGAPLPPSAAG